MADVLQGPTKVSGRYALVAFFDEQRLAASFSDGRAFLWTLAPSPLRPRELPTIAGIHAAAIDTGDRRLATVASLSDDPAGATDRIQIWNLGTTPAPKRPPCASFGPATVRSTGSSTARTGGGCLTVSDTAISLWNANVWKATGDDGADRRPRTRRPLSSVAFEADGVRILTGSADWRRPRLGRSVRPIAGGTFYARGGGHRGRLRRFRRKDSSRPRRTRSASASSDSAP